LPPPLPQELFPGESICPSEPFSQRAYTIFDARANAKHELEPQSMLILDFYVDEPACFGVPPYLSPYARYAAGALVSAGIPQEKIEYLTVDDWRAQGKELKNDPELVILIGGATVPGKYLGGKIGIRVVLRVQFIYRLFSLRLSERSFWRTVIFYAVNCNSSNFPDSFKRFFCTSIFCPSFVKLSEIVV
jgi:hypothetical protein